MMSVRSASARRTAPSTSVGAGASEGRSTGRIVWRHIGSSVPLTMIALQREFRGLRGRFGGGQVLPARRRFGLRLDDVERRERADFDARLVVFDQLVGQLGGALRDVDRALREDQIPIGVADVGQRLGDRRARALFRDVAIDRVDQQLLAECCRS